MAVATGIAGPQWESQSWSILSGWARRGMFTDLRIGLARLEGSGRYSARDAGPVLRIG
jgi:hypothetical protein